MRLTRGPKPPKTTADAFIKARRDILQTIQRIPRSKVASYSGVAFAAGWPGRARLVARVLSEVADAVRGEASSSLATPGPAILGWATASEASSARKASLAVPPEYEGLPWFRVINAQGRIAIPKSSPGHLKQQRLLKAEGVVILNGKISFSAHGWQPGDQSPLLD